MAKAKPAVTEYQAVCQGRAADGREWVHRSPQYQAAPHAREWADGHRFEDHEAGDGWLIDLVVYPPGGTPFAVDRWEPTGSGSPDPGRWWGRTGGSSPMSVGGRIIGRAQVTQALEALRGAVAPTRGAVGTVTPAEYAQAVRDGFDRFGDAGAPPGTHTTPAVPVPLEEHPDADRASCGHVATAYDEHGDPLCELESCMASGGVE